MLKEKPIICGIVAVGPYDVIGYGAGMPWYSKQDFYHFRKTTTPWPVIFGKNTYDGMPKKPLPNRFNLVCGSHYQDEYINGIFCAKSLESALSQCSGFERVFICGGAGLYKYALEHDLIDEMFVTQIYNENLAEQIKNNPDAYTRFPVDTDEFFKSPKWFKESMLYSSKSLPVESISIRCKFYKYSRVR